MSAKTFVAAVAAASIAQYAHAQAVHRVGFVSPIAPGPTIEAFRSGLREHGYIEGKNMVLEARFADGHLDRPGLSHVAVLSNSADPETRVLLGQIREAALYFKVDSLVVDARRDDEFAAALGAISNSGAQAPARHLFVPAFPGFRRPDVLRRQSGGQLPGCRVVCRQDIEGRAPGRLAGRATDTTRVDHQPQGRARTGHNLAELASPPRGPSDSIDSRRPRSADAGPERGVLMQTAFTRLLSLQAPLMQAPIGRSAGPQLVASVSNAGALGALTIWGMPPERVAHGIQATRALTGKQFAVNVRADLDQHGHVDAALESGARLVHLFWGDPTPYVATVHRAGAKVIAAVANADEAKQALDAGADILIAQGWEAGGHVQGTIATISLVPAVVDLAGPVPVLAAGGIADGRGLAAVLMLGASGAVMGTRFVASEESRAHPIYKRALVAARQADALYLADLFDVGWPNAPHRALRNSTVRAWEASGRPAPGSRPNENEPIGTRADGSVIVRYAMPSPVSDETGNVEAMAHYAGQGVEGIREILPAASIVERTVREAEHCLSKYAA